MAPRPAASRTDETAIRFLSAAAELIDRGFLSAEQRGRHPANALKFPASFHWLRIEDVLRVAAESGSYVSRKSFHNRWPDKDSFIRDAIVYTMCYRDAPERDPIVHLRAVEGLFCDPELLLEDVWAFSIAVFTSMRQNPRSYLMIHLTPSIANHPEIEEVVKVAAHEASELWRATYTGLIERLGLELRDGWTITSLDLTFQALMEGFLVCERARTGVVRTQSSTAAEMFARAVCAVVASALAPAVSLNQEIDG